MGLGERTARRHETAASKTAGLTSSDYWDFKPGQKVMTVDGFPGTVASVEDGPLMGMETYVVTLANGMGGGFYTTSQLASISEVTASEIHTAADDYPELGTVLEDHPDIAPNKTGSKTASANPWGSNVTPKHQAQPPCPTCGAPHDPALHETPHSYCETCGITGHDTSVHTRPPYEEEPYILATRHTIYTGESDVFDDRHVASLQKGAPFAGYKDFEACVAANKDKKDPKAYCGAIKHQVEDKMQNEPKHKRKKGALLPQDHGEHGPWNLHGQCKKCGWSAATEDDEECDDPVCKGFPEGWHTKGEHVDPADRDPYSDASRNAEKSMHDAFGKEDHPLGFLLDQQKQGPSKFSAVERFDQALASPDPQVRARAERISDMFQLKRPLEIHRQAEAGFDPWHILTTAAGDPEFRFEVTASWSDVRNKAKRIMKDGGVHVTLSTKGMVIAEVQGDHYTYETGLQRHPGRQAIAAWSCGCKWGAYHWGAADDFSRFAGRMCSHALAVQYEAQSRGMFGHDVDVDTVKPRWVPRSPVVKYDIDDDKNVRAPGSSIPTSAMKTGGVSFAPCRECGSTDHHSGQHNFGEPTDHEHVGYVEDGIMCRDCVEKGKVKTDNPDPISWNELRSKVVHGADCDHCGKEITPARPHTEKECEYGDDCPDLDPKYGEGHISEGDPRNAVFGTEEDRKNVEDEDRKWKAGEPERAKHRTENDENAEHEIGQIGTPEQRKFLEGNPTGPSKYSSLSVASTLIRYAMDQGEQIGEITLALHASGMSLPTVTAAVNDAWGEPDPPPGKHIPGPTKAPDPQENPASAGWASGNDPDSWSQAGPSGVNHMIAGRRADMCQNCGQEIHDASGVDPSVPWVHAASGNSYCDVHGTNDAALLAGSPLERSEAAPVMHQAGLDDEAMFEPEMGKEAVLPALIPLIAPLLEGAGAAGAGAGAAGAAGLGAAEVAGAGAGAAAAGAGAGEVAAGMGAKEIAGGIGKQVLKNQVVKQMMPHGSEEQGSPEPTGPEGPSGPTQVNTPGPGWNAMDYGARAELHDQPEGALPSTDSESNDDDPFRGAGDIGSPKSLEPDSSSFVSTGSVQDVVAQFQATAGAQALQGGSHGGDDGLDIAGAAKEYLAKESLKAFTPGEQHQIINEGEDVKAANLDRLNLTGTHYTALEAALVAAEEDEDDKESWLS